MEKKQMSQFMNVRRAMPAIHRTRHSRTGRFNERNLVQLADLSIVQMYSNLVQKCFENCVDDFTSAKVNSKEEGCVMRCVDKFLKSSERLGQRFQEQNAAMAQGGGMLGGR